MLVAINRAVAIECPAHRLVAALQVPGADEGQRE